MNTTTQNNPDAAAALDSAVRELVMANRILAHEGILDGFGHVSVRHPANAAQYLISRQLAPALVQREDIVTLDLDSNHVEDSTASLFLERFIHGEIYRRRPDVRAIVHSHSPTTIPFGITRVKLRPLYHMSGFIGAGPAHFEIADSDANSDMLVRNPQLGVALAEALGDAPLALMRGHGNVVVAGDIKAVVYRAIYCELNAKLQLQALQLDPEPRYLSAAEGANADTTNMKVVARPWRYWADRAGCLDLLDP